MAVERGDTWWLPALFLQRSDGSSAAAAQGDQQSFPKGEKDDDLSPFPSVVSLEYLSISALPRDNTNKCSRDNNAAAGDLMASFLEMGFFLLF